MRTHRVFPALQPWASRTTLLRELVSGEHLVAARIEPVTRARDTTALVDLTFGDGTRTVTIPLVYLDLAQLDVRETDPLIFPHHLLGVVPDAGARDVVERLVPELERRAYTGGFATEDTIVLRPDAVYAAARARGFFGAAPLTTSLPRIAGAVYAWRFAVGKHIATYGPDAVEIAAFLRTPASSCVAFADAAPDARAWFGDLEAAEDGAHYDVLVGSGTLPACTAAITLRLDDAGDGLHVPVATPLPADLLLSFSAIDGGEATRFAVTATREPFARTIDDVLPVAAIGGSGGRIAVAVRPDADLVPDSDTDEAAALAAGLRREGFTVEIVHGIDALDAFAPDFVHLFGVRPGSFARRVADWTSAHRKALAVHALLESPALGGYWGAMVTPYCFGYSGDDRSVKTYLDLLARRSVEVDGIGAATPWAPAGAGFEDVERVLGMADLVFVNSDRELRAVTPLRGQRPTFIVPSLAMVPAAPEPIGARVGTDAFALVHAPVSPAANQLMIARAASAVGIPVVIAGPVEDVAYAERLREFAPAQMMLIDEPSPGAVAALYRAASVFIDASWTNRGHGRLVTAAALGAAIVRSSSCWVDFPEQGNWVVDMADAVSIERGIGEAWDAAVRRDEAIASVGLLAREASATAVSVILASYAKIAQEV